MTRQYRDSSIDVRSYLVAQAVTLYLASFVLFKEADRRAKELPLQSDHWASRLVNWIADVSPYVVPEILGWFSFTSACTLFVLAINSRTFVIGLHFLDLKVMRQVLAIFAVVVFILGWVPFLNESDLTRLHKDLLIWSGMFFTLLLELFILVNEPGKNRQSTTGAT
jgi:hypothetical protein